MSTNILPAPAVDLISVQFGTIVSARVMRGENGLSKGFGFVSYSTPDQGRIQSLSRFTQIDLAS